MNLLMVIMMRSLKSYYLEIHRDLMMVKCMVLIKASNCDCLMLMYLAICLKMYMESSLVLMMEQNWDISNSFDGYNVYKL